MIVAWFLTSLYVAVMEEQDGAKTYERRKKDFGCKFF